MTVLLLEAQGGMLVTALATPPGMGGDGALIRIGPPLLRQEAGACFEGRALRARPLLVQQPGRPRRKPVEDYVFKPMENLLDAVEYRGKSIAQAGADRWNTRNCSQAHATWALEAARSYLTAREREQAARVAAGHPATFPVQSSWVGGKQLSAPDERGVDQYERTIWGRRYASADGEIRELWIPSIDCVKLDRPLPELVAAAHVLVTGVPARTPYGERSIPLPSAPPPPRRVRVLGVGLRDASTVVLADWNAEEVKRLFEENVRGLMARVVDGRGRRSGMDCVRCEALAGCRTVARVPGLLGVPGPVRPRKRRSVSVSDLRAHRDCAARYYLTRVLKLRDGRTENEAIRRGRAVDAWLNERHAERPLVPCRRVPLPDTLPGLTEDELPAALSMIRGHRGLCPLDGLPATERVEPQRRIAVYDDLADVVVIADCDVVYTDEGGVVVRETKTAAHRFGERRDLVETFPQLALAVLMLASGALGGDPRRSRVELEVLREDGARLEELDPCDGRTLDQSRRVLTELATGWAAEETYPAEPAPGFDCSGCEALRWCAVGQSRQTTDIPEVVR
ncbi:PD-(D/E)XK nuclease family protein [Streptomyces sp. MPA0124]|uniref:PD-(D/E)XK nuclease family protein n=1 Tax=unclassified Streptomyces TaxID=2593676 RepID=UPI0013A5A45A|nr:PD-(D/E)XK nuclease family protein [Streptomyces sp. CS207]